MRTKPIVLVQIDRRWMKPKFRFLNSLFLLAAPNVPISITDWQLQDVQIERT